MTEQHYLHLLLESSNQEQKKKVMVDLFAFFDAHPPKAGGLVKAESNEFVSLDDSPGTPSQNMEPQEAEPKEDQKEEAEETKQEQDEQNEELENPYEAYYRQKEAEKLAKKGKKEGTFGIRQGVRKMKQDKCK